ncbi:diacylglycerol/lipid kinase family protein [Tissierella creatinophila]|uniref:Diacylglycerol kinase n=1 Tax=Tissierella creatinophila DSM 6911 TaxID=1123403 RepID=A0A1U7M5C8_TISCR|nr:YegS/Rv2252/BmrU family lipid kinase [Tissierella creatinophila]OLS02522.1 diacylglycerol kinase [Tissierella creatinophila DSM 6911]
MERIKLIINPSSGRQAVETRVDYLCKLLLDDGYTLGKYYTQKKDDAVNETIKTCSSGEWDTIIACGGDGTINEVATGIAKSTNKLPVAILQSGTVNDFANYMNMPSKIPDFFKMIKNRHIVEIDLGKVNNKYFVNVAAGGLLTDVGFQVPIEAKALLGRMAYYFEGLRTLILQGIEPIHLSFESEEYTKEEDVLLFVVSNSASIGGFKKLAPDADVLDGLLDVLIIKNSDIPELANIFFNVLKGDHINHPNVVYFKTKNILIRAKKNITIDIDGEAGGRLPANFKVIPSGMKIIVNK